MLTPVNTLYCDALHPSLTLQQQCGDCWPVALCMLCTGIIRMSGSRHGEEEELCKFVFSCVIFL